jgi:hypothetical protein
MQLNVFAWIREGVKRSVLLGVSDAVEAIGAPEDDDGALKQRLSQLLLPEAIRVSSTPALLGKRKRLGKSLRDGIADSP